MKHLFLIDGAAGTGKTDLVRFIHRKCEPSRTATVVMKFTTRGKRKTEKVRRPYLDLQFIKRHQFVEMALDNSFYSYEYEDELYGFWREDIEVALRGYDNVFLVVRDRETIVRLSEDFSQVRVVPTFVYSDKAEIRKRLKLERVFSAGDIRKRLKRQQAVYDDYLKQFDLYEHVILNNSNRMDFERLVQGLLDRYKTSPPNELVVGPRERYRLVAPLVGFRDTIRARLRKTDYSRNVFLMMRFRQSNRRIYAFIRKSLEDQGFNCVRADQPEWKMTRDVYNPIAVLYCCKFGIALFDAPEKRNIYSANVAYELGMMHLQGKDCLILKHSRVPELPFDLISQLHDTYSHQSELEQMISEWVVGLAQ